MPLIVVTFNYRLGIFGFFHSKELADEASRQNEVPLQFRSTGNLGLVDAHYAFDWVCIFLKPSAPSTDADAARVLRSRKILQDLEVIQKISQQSGSQQVLVSSRFSISNEFEGLVGSRYELTRHVSGTINYLVLTPQLQIHIPRIILSSSTCASIQLLRPSQAQSWFDAVCEKLHIDPRSDRSVAQLRDVATEKLIEESSFALSSFRPIWDDITITADAREVFSNPYVWDPSLKEVILGVCQNEPWIRQAALLDQKSELPRLIKGRIPPSPPELRNRAYELYAEDCLFPWFKVPPGVPRFHQSALAFEGHMRYYSPAQLFSDSFIRSEKGGRAIFRYVLSWVSAHFPPTWPVTHTADILLTFLHKSLAAAEVPVALSFVDQLIAFSTGNRGKMLWKGYTSSQRCLNELDENGTWQVLEDRNGAFDLMDEYSEFCSQVMNASVKAGREGWSEMIR
ncbi:hypothetical protein VTK73DRAFT_3061 [Phialemonium thermophilum]|uniref:Carboxylesterase type B domain-containing protein n=1 Tax=Phialemonium thermophilum TaxID=223376 RepID=A0ABR3X1A5_9PEZI